MILSIVIPVYNGANHIAKCLDSIWVQGLDTNEYEVICVNDCSTDNTQETLTRICREHSNLRLIKNETNRRAGGSRNHGVSEAKGEYIVFIDADDYFHKGSLKEIFKVIQENRELDIILCDFAREHVGTVSNNPTHNWQERNVISGRSFMLNNGVPFSPWQYVFKKKLMINNNIFFEENVSAEDVDWSHALALKAEKMQYYHILLSHYVLHNSSQTADEFKNFRLISERMFAGYRMNKLAAKYNYDKEVSRYLNIIADLFFYKALQFMTGIYCTPKVKSSTIKRYIHQHGEDKLICFAYKHPTLFAYLSNITSPFIKVAIIIRRFIKGR